MECDYRLVENEGLFQEYLEMGKITYIDWYICTNNVYIDWL